MKRLLITGAGGFLGWNLCRELRERWEIVGAARSRPVPMESVRSVVIDLTDPSAVRRMLLDVHPDGVIHAAAAAKPDYCQLHPKESARINVDVPILLADLCADAGIPLVFTSSDLVFDGRNPPYRENDPVSPLSVYGEQKVRAEEEILQRHPAAAVCRMALMFGNGGPHGASFLEPMVRAMRQGEELKLFTDELRTPISGRDAALGLELAIRKASGLLHLGGPERISRYAFGSMISEVFDVHEPRFTPALQSEVSTPAPRPPDVSLDSSKALRLGFRQTPLQKSLRELTAGFGESFQKL